MAHMCTTGKRKARFSSATSAAGAATASESSDDDTDVDDNMNDDESTNMSAHGRPSRAAKTKIAPNACTGNGTIKDSMSDTDDNNDVDYNDEHSTDSSDDETCGQHIKNVRTMSKRVLKVTVCSSQVFATTITSTASTTASATSTDIMTITVTAARCYTSSTKDMKEKLAYERARLHLVKPFITRLTRDMKDETLPVERTEPATTQAKHDQYGLWYTRVNSECDCSTVETKCGDKCRSVVQEIAAIAGSNTAQQRRKLFK
eukprot:8138-Heterococcus_DN1.PRE.1